MRKKSITIKKTIITIREEEVVRDKSSDQRSSTITIKRHRINTIMMVNNNTGRKVMEVATITRDHRVKLEAILEVEEAQELIIQIIVVTIITNNNNSIKIKNSTKKPTRSRKYLHKFHTVAKPVKFLLSTKKSK